MTVPIEGVMTKRQRKGCYLYQRPDSGFWWLKLQAPSFKRISLKTTDRLEAEIAAAPHIQEHKARVLAARPVPADVAFQREYEPGLHDGPEGGKIFATERELHYLDADGKIRVRGPNRAGLGFAVPAPGTRPTLAVRTDDDKLFATYIKDADLDGYYKREAETVWALFKTLTDNKALKDCDRDDGRLLAEHFAGQGIKSATVRKKIGWLTAMVNLAIRDRKLPPFNPFTGVVGKNDDKEARLPLSDADIRECKKNLDRLSESDQLLFRLLAASGMRLSEAFEIDREEIERRVRFTIVGKKTEQSKRRVPFPATVLKYLPAKITGQLFAGDTPAAASKRLNRFLRDDCGITDTRKVIHSLRHRAKDRLRAADCPLILQWELLGHEEKTVGEDYGKGSPVPKLKQWIDKIGC
jgi:integrase